jgi:hypothetical protein
MLKKELLKLIIFNYIKYYTKIKKNRYNLYINKKK